MNWYKVAEQHLKALVLIYSAMKIHRLGSHIDRLIIYLHIGMW